VQRQRANTRIVERNSLTADGGNESRRAPAAKELSSDLTLAKGTRGMEASSVGVRRGSTNQFSWRSTFHGLVGFGSLHK